MKSNKKNKVFTIKFEIILSKKKYFKKLQVDICFECIAYKTF